MRPIYPKTVLAKTVIGFVAVIIAGMCLLISCNTGKKPLSIDPAFSKYIEAYTSGVISKKNAIRIRLSTDANTTHTLNEAVKEDLFSFSPSVAGKAYWIDARTIEFKPDADLNPDELYEVSFQLGNVLTVPSKFKKFKFNIEVIKPAYQVEDNGFRSFGKNRMELSGQITTADVESSEAVEKIFSATLNGSKVPVKWQHNEINKQHNFIIEDIQRKTTEGSLLLEWQGSPIHASLQGKKELAVPATGDFKVMNIQVVQADEQYILVQFSDPLAQSQSLDGLITVSEQENPGYTIAGSEVKIYSSTRYEGNYSVNVNEGILNEWENKLAKTFTGNVFFENRLPAVKIQGKGVLLPNSGGKVVLPFEATNLKAVDVSIIKIFESNVPQFLQSNTFDGSEELRKLARPLVQATIALDNDKSLDLHKKNRFMLDLDKYLKTEPGAIYRVQIGFRAAYSLYTCNGSQPVEQFANENDSEVEYSPHNGVDDDNDFWRHYDNFYPYNFNWSKRNDPCNVAYYNGERFASRNIIATNLGLTAKKGNDNSLFVSVNNLISTEPVNGVELQVLDYQQQVVGKGSTSGDGIALIQLSRKPYLLVAKKGTEKSYLRIDDGSALPLARFDVNGVEVKNGIKGFIFGERGVWRPGDSLFLGCIIEDKTKKIPADHPIELELFTPQGQVYKKIIATYAADGFNVFKTATDASAPTGNWLCKVKLGGAVFEKRLKIETVMPNRLKIDLSFGGANALGKNAAVNGILSANWLFGSPAQNLKAKVDAQLYKRQTTFAGFNDYVFDNPVSQFAPQSKTIFDGSLNDHGIAYVNPSFDVGKQAPGMLLANLTVKVFEPGGNFSIDNIALPYNPYSSYAGIKAPEGDKQWGFLLNNQKQVFDLVDLGTDGKLTGGKTDVEVSLYKIQWRWWWDNTGENISNFTQDKFNKLIKKENVILNNGKGTYNVKIDGSYGRYLLLAKDIRSGHTTGKIFYVDDNNWQSRNDQSSDGAAAMLSFSTDKAKYNSGEKVNLSIPSSEGGKALISIETGSRVLKTYLVKTTKGQTRFSFTAEKEMSPNVFVTVSLIQPHAQTINDLPIRMYGVMPVMIEDKNTQLKPLIQVNETIRPEQPVNITVSEADHKSMSYVVAIVDEGLLDLTHFKTPDPHETFYAKEALGVKSWDVYDYVIGAWGGELQRILTIGGDAEAALSSKTRRANRFKPIVKFMGPFKTNGSAQTHSFTLPPYMGSVRAMVIAAGKEGYGAAEKSIKVKKPLMLLATLPRVLGPSEELKIPVTVFATDPSVKTVSLHLQSNPFIEAAGDQTIAFNKMGEQVAYFRQK